MPKYAPCLATIGQMFYQIVAIYTKLRLFPNFPVTYLGKLKIRNEKNNKLF